jgi:hypothetical protein
MKSKLTLISVGGAALLATAGCASGPAPVQRLADAQAAARSAEEVGARTLPRGDLHLRLAFEQIDAARALMRRGDNDRAALVLLRARADAELALGEARQQDARVAAQRAQERVAELTRENAATTTTTGATIQENEGR